MPREMRADRGGMVGGPAPSPRSGTVGELGERSPDEDPGFGTESPVDPSGYGRDIRPAIGSAWSTPLKAVQVILPGGKRGDDQRSVDRRHRLRHPERWLRSSGPCPTSRMAGTAGLWGPRSMGHEGEHGKQAVGQAVEGLVGGDPQRADPVPGVLPASPSPLGSTPGLFFLPRRGPHDPPGKTMKCSTGIFRGTFQGGKDQRPR